MGAHYQDGMMLGDIASLTPGPDVLQHRRYVQATWIFGVHSCIM